MKDRTREKLGPYLPHARLLNPASKLRENRTSEAPGHEWPFHQTGRLPRQVCFVSISLASDTPPVLREAVLPALKRDVQQPE